ncbi:Uncharacterised protein [Mycobacteroides abscessus subsp. massiliense]|uniref:hypothetical protein n=1 Tax=Mycobacteroides abscessus TaxID=36809 RepID=UPI0009A56DDE|nr:hypothetical protein [Mycobacteroides abscessus]SLE83276.1 Uncharacterised protein [Mycobacteroides abscessus subsp. massiliense]
MTAPHEGGGWIARSFTRARILGMYLSRVTLGDKSFELPVILNKTQLGAAFTGALISGLFYVAGAVFGIGGQLLTVSLVLTAAAVIGLRFVPTPERGVPYFLEGYARTAWAALPFTSTMRSSRPRPPRRRTHHVVLRMRENPPLAEQRPARHLYEG